MKLNSFVQFATLIAFGASVLVQAQTMRVYQPQNSTINYVVSDIDSVKYNSQKDTMLLYYPKRGKAIKFKVSGIDSVKFDEGVKYGTLVDSRDGQVYKTVVIGTQTWMAQNLNYGKMILSGSTSTLQNGAQKFCYNDSTKYCDSDGGLYQWHTAMGFDSTCASTNCTSQISSGNHQGICLVGWHIPKANEWNTLRTFLGDFWIAGSKMKLNNTGITYWDIATHNDGNSSGFAALSAGGRNFNGDFDIFGSYAYFWEADENNENSLSLSYFRILSYFNSSFDINYGYKTTGFSIRCVKD